jgi:hypothetical protein
MAGKLIGERKILRLQPSLLTNVHVICSQFGHEVLEVDSSTLWFAGKQMLNEKKLSDYLGRCEQFHRIHEISFQNWARACVGLLTCNLNSLLLVLSGVKQVCL